eukprot:g1748.t1
MARLRNSMLVFVALLWNMATIAVSAQDEYEEYLYTTTHTYTTSDTFGSACATGSSDCSYDVVFTLNKDMLTSTPCVAFNPFTSDCRMNAAGGEHTLNVVVYDVSTNAGSPVVATNPISTAYRDDLSPSNELVFQGQDPATVLSSAIFSVSSYVWGTFDNTSNTRAFNGHEWEDVRVLSGATDLNEGDANVTAENAFTTRIEYDDAGEFKREVNITSKTLTKVDYQSSYPKRNETVTIESTTVVCKNGTGNPDSSISCDFSWTLDGDIDGCPTTFSVSAMTKYTCQGTSTSLTQYSGFMWVDNAKTPSNSGLEVVNIGETVLPQTDVKSVAFFSLPATDSSTQTVSGSGDSYYFLKMGSMDALGAKSDALWSLLIADRPKFCDSGSTPTACNSNGDCTGSSCVSSALSTITSMGRDTNLVRDADCVVEFDVVATGPSATHAYAPTGINPINLPQGASFTCSAASGNAMSCRFSWTTTAADVGDHLVCFAAVDGTAESNSPSCQAIRIIPDTSYLKLTFPTIGSVQTCTTKRLIWLDTSIAVDNTNEVDLYLCDSQDACSSIATGIEGNSTSCDSNGLCDSFSWSVPETLIQNETYTFRLNSSVIACQAEGVKSFVASAKPSPLTILSPGGVGSCGSSDWYRGCYSGASVSATDENVVVFTQQETLDISISVCSVSNPSDCQTLVNNTQYVPGTYTLAVDLSPSGSLYSWIQADTAYKVTISAQCYETVESTFMVRERGSDFISVSIDDSQLYRCNDYTLTIGATTEVGAVDISGDLITTTMDIPVTTSHAFTVSSSESSGAKTVTANAQSYTDSCVPQNSLQISVVDYPSQPIVVNVPATSATLLTCEDITPSAVYDASLSSLNLGQVEWTAKVGGSVFAQQSVSVSTVRPLPADAGSVMSFEFQPATAALRDCISTVVSNFTIVTNDKPLTFQSEVPSEVYPCTNVTLSWTSSYADFDDGIAVNVSIFDSAGNAEIVRIATDTVAVETVWPVPSTFTAGQYQLRVSSNAVPTGCMSTGTKMITVESWASNAIAITQTPSAGIYRCNSFDFQWDAVTTQTNLDVCICQNCDSGMPSNRSKCYGLDENTANKNYPLNTLPGSPIGQSRIYVSPADEAIAQCLETANATFEVLTTQVDVSSPAFGDVWQPFCEYLIDWESEWALGPLRLSLCVDGNCTDAKRTDVLRETTNRE